MSVRHTAAIFPRYARSQPDPAIHAHRATIDSGKNKQHFSPLVGELVIFFCLESTYNGLPPLPPPLLTPPGGGGRFDPLPPLAASGDEEEEEEERAHFHIHLAWLPFLSSCAAIAAAAAAGDPPLTSSREKTTLSLQSIFFFLCPISEPTDRPPPARSSSS